jgi:hypothetical protein
LGTSVSPCAEAAAAAVAAAAARSDDDNIFALAEKDTLLEAAQTALNQVRRCKSTLSNPR